MTASTLLRLDRWGRLAPSNFPPSFRCYRCGGLFADRSAEDDSALAIEVEARTGWPHCDECAAEYFEAT